MKQLALLGCLVVLSGCEDKDLRKCEDAIKKELKAPASYHRVESRQRGDGALLITYDAVNSFNAPLRSSGHCYAVGDTAFWFEDHKSGD